MLNSSFSLLVPGLQLAWDSTSLGLLKECPKKYEYAIVKGFVGREENVHLVFGLLYHATLERYDHARSAGASHDDATIAAVRYAMQATWDRSLKRPWASSDEYKNRYTLVRTVVWYLEEFRDDPMKTVQLASGKPAVELSFRMDLPAYPPGEGIDPYILCGHLDRVVDFNGSLYVLDRKTTKSSFGERYFKQFNPHNQFSIYAAASKVVLGSPGQGIIVDAAQIGVNFSRFQRGIIQQSESLLEEFLLDTVAWIRLAEGYAQAGHWPKNETACDKYFGCPYREVCKLGAGGRDQWLKAGFSKRVWDPLQVRGDI